MARLIAMDFDRTLLNDEKKVSFRTRKALEECRRRGILLVGVTARVLGSVKDLNILPLFDFLF